MECVTTILYALAVSGHFLCVEAFVKYGPSLAYLSGYNDELQRPNLLNSDTGRILDLRDYPDFSVVLPIVDNSSTTTSNQLFISRTATGAGEFLVKAPPGYGIIAVIQSLDLRTGVFGCNDYLQLSTEGMRETSGEICGKVDNRDGNIEPLGLRGSRTFITSDEKLKVLFYHGYLWGLVRNFSFDVLHPSRNPVLRAELVFTAYKSCEKTGDFLTRRHYDSLIPSYTYWPCDSDQEVCISSNLFCNSIKNCGFLSNRFASDESVINCAYLASRRIFSKPFNSITSRRSFGRRLNPFTLSYSEQIRLASLGVKAGYERNINKGEKVSSNSVESSLNVVKADDPHHNKTNDTIKSNISNNSSQISVSVSSNSSSLKNNVGGGPLTPQTTSDKEATMDGKLYVDVSRPVIQDKYYYDGEFEQNNGVVVPKPDDTSGFGSSTYYCTNMVITILIIVGTLGIMSCFFCLATLCYYKLCMRKGRQWKTQGPPVSERASRQESNVVEKSEEFEWRRSAFGSEDPKAPRLCSAHRFLIEGETRDGRIGNDPTTDFETTSITTETEEEPQPKQTSGRLLTTKKIDEPNNYYFPDKSAAFATPPPPYRHVVYDVETEN